MDRLERVPHAAFSKELRLPKVRVPTGTADPAAHHEAAARHPINVAWRRAGDQFQNLIAHLRGAPLVGIKAENPIAAAGLDGAVAQIAETLERHRHDARPKRRR